MILGVNTSKFVFFILASPFMLLLLHVLAVRLVLFFKIDISNQKLLFLCVFFFNFPVLIVFYFLGIYRQTWLGYIYVIVVFNSFAYFYFHVFNMSETARRIKILVGVNTGKLKNVSAVEKFYDYEKALLVRLDRLEQLSQVKKSGGRYYLRQKLFYYISWLIPIFRLTLGFVDKLETLEE